MIAFIAALAGAGEFVIAMAGAAGVFLTGVALWLLGENTRRKWDEVGRGIMVSVGLAVVLGVPQYLLAEEQKRRDFLFSLTLQNNLDGADLAGRDLSEIRLMSKSMERADLSEATLAGAQMVNTNLRRANLTGADLSGADLRYAHLENASLVDADLSGANLKNAHLEDAVLPGVDLSGADLELSHLNRGCLADADLQGARLAGANLAGAVLTSADIRGTVFESDLRPAKLERTGLAGVTHDTRTVWPLDFRFARAVRGRPEPVQQAAAAVPREAFPARVVGIADGDTIRIASTAEDGAELGPGRARLIGVNAPDLNDPGGIGSRRFARRMLRGKTVQVQVGKPRLDDGDRTRVYVWRSEGQTFNEELLAAGWASVAIDKGEALARRMRDAEDRAKKRGVGLWRRCPRPDEDVEATRPATEAPFSNLRR